MNGFESFATATATVIVIVIVIVIATVEKSFQLRCLYRCSNVRES